MTKDTIIQLVIHAVLSGGFLGSIYALLKLRPEAGQITVTAAQGALVVQSGVIDDLNEELKRVKDEVIALRKENTELKKRVVELERLNQ